MARATTRHSDADVASASTAFRAAELHRRPPARDPTGRLVPAARDARAPFAVSACVVAAAMQPAQGSPGADSARAWVAFEAARRASAPASGFRMPRPQPGRASSSTHSHRPQTGPRHSPRSAPTPRWRRRERLRVHPNAPRAGRVPRRRKTGTAFLERDGDTNCRCSSDDLFVLDRHAFVSTPWTFAHGEIHPRCEPGKASTAR